MAERKGRSRLGKRTRIFLYVVLCLLSAALVGLVVLSPRSTSAAERPRYIPVDALMLIAVDTDGDGQHDHEITVTDVINVAAFDDGRYGVWLQGGIESLDPLSE